MSQVATIIKNQIGNKALYMMGAKNLATGGDDLSFRVRGSKRVNHVKIALNASDTYDITFGKILGLKFNVVASHDGIYCDMMHDLIEKETGLYLSL